MAQNPKQGTREPDVAPPRPAGATRPKPTRDEIQDRNARFGPKVQRIQRGSGRST